MPGQRRDVLGIGQKSGVYWAVDPSTGHTLWGTQVGPGGSLGGIEWGSATDGNRIYVAIGNNGHVPYTLKGSGPFAGQTITGGSFSAVDAATGTILWQTPDPQGALDLGFVTVANGVVYWGSVTTSAPSTTRSTRSARRTDSSRPARCRCGSAPAASGAC